jgi:hypothetical protein
MIGYCMYVGRITRQWTPFLERNLGQGSMHGWPFELCYYSESAVLTYHLFITYT